MILSANPVHLDFALWLRRHNLRMIKSTRLHTSICLEDTFVNLLRLSIMLLSLYNQLWTGISLICACSSYYFQFLTLDSSAVRYWHPNVHEQVEKYVNFLIKDSFILLRKYLGLYIYLTQIPPLKFWLFCHLLTMEKFRIFL